MDKLLSPCQEKMSDRGNRRMVTHLPVHVYIEVMEIPQDQDKKPYRVQHIQTKRPMIGGYLGLLDSSELTDNAQSTIKLDKSAILVCMPNGYHKEEPHVRWCERLVNTKVGDKHL